LSGPLDGAASFRRVDQRELEAIRDAGFDTVRLPVRWSAHAEPAAPYALDPVFCACVDRAVDDALARGLNVVLDVHHYDALSAAPAVHAERFLALWEQITARYAERPPRLYLELLNEPHDELRGERWNRLLTAALSVVRARDPGRVVIAGPARRNTIAGLEALELPEDDGLIVTVHFYLPFAFTHQGAGWLDDAGAWLGTTWGDARERAALRAELAAAAGWAAERGRPLFVGEFGVLETVPLPARAAWTALVRAEAERLGSSWAYWDFGTDFGAYDRARRVWRAPLRAALLPGAAG
jgi:endoglucanase